MPMHRTWWFALLVVQIVSALAGLAIGLGTLIRALPLPISDDWVTDPTVRGAAIIVLAMLTGAAAVAQMIGARFALVLTCTAALLLLGWMHVVAVALGEHTAVGLFFTALGTAELVAVLLLLGVTRGTTIPAPAPQPEPDEPVLFDM